MPQFDTITFFNQIFWLLFLFSGFYFLLLKIYLPRISSSLKIRTKKLAKSNAQVEKLASENFGTFSASSELNIFVLSNKVAFFEKQKKCATQRIFKQHSFELGIVSAYYQAYKVIAVKKILNL